MPGRKFTQGGSGYRYGFNGQEKSDDVTAGNYTAMYWEYDSRTGRRWNVDPIVKDWESPYLCFSGNPIYYADPNGMDPEDPKGKTLSEVVVVCKLPKEGTNRINPKVLRSPTVNDLKNTLSDFLTITPGGVKPPEQKELINPFQRYHRTSKYFDAGWYDEDVYDLTTYDWDNGQVMGERNLLDKTLTQLEFNDYTPLDGIYGGRDWNGYQVNDKGYLTGNVFSGPSPYGMQLMGRNPIKAVRNTLVFLNRLGKVMNTTSSRLKFLGGIQNSKLKNIVNDLIRINKNRIGNGSAMDAFRYEQATGRMVGGKSHMIKIMDYKNALGKVLKQTLNSSDRKLANEILKDIIRALKGE